MAQDISNDFPRIIYWKSSHEHLINNDISLSEFQNDTSISIPLRNIFKIYGCKNDQDIINTIERALSNSESKSELEDTLSDFVTSHINNIWKEHKIKLIIKFDGDLCKVHVVDLSSKYKYYNMKNRSDGFKQFVSLMLSLSAENDSNNLKDNIILLDEPEVHLHPSGIRYLRDEILKIGKKNHVIVSTHSHYLVDTETPERHWIVEKNKKTIIKQLSETASFADDEVLSKAFGLALMKELLPSNILLLEGLGDKIVFNHMIRLLDRTLNFTIKTTGGASKIQNVAALLSDEKIKTSIILDADSEGIQAYDYIVKNLKPHFNSKNVFTLKSIDSLLPKDSTLEDIYPLEFINAFVKKRYPHAPDFNKDATVANQLKKLDNSNFSGTNGKENLESIKKELSEEFIKEYDTLEKLQPHTSLITFFETVLAKMRN